MISDEQRATIRRLFFAEHWKVGTIAAELGLHHDAVHNAIQSRSFLAPVLRVRAEMLDPYRDFIQVTLEQYPHLRATRLHEMLRDRGYEGSVFPVRRFVARKRPSKHEAFLRLSVLPGEQAQVDWASFGSIVVGRAKRGLSCFLMVLSWSRALFARFYLDQTTESFLHGHLAAFAAFGGVPRTILYDNLKSAVLERVHDAIRFHPTLLELAARYRFAPRPVALARGNEKGRVERAIRFVRERFFAARRFADLADLNAQALAWCAGEAAERPCPEDRERSVRACFEAEHPCLLALPPDPFPCEERVSVRAPKTPYVRFDLNDYSIPHTHVRRTLEVVATLESVRILDGAAVLAVHRRSFDRATQIEDPAHLQALLDHKRAGRGHRAMDRLHHATPSAAKFFARAAERGVHLGSLTRGLIDLLNTHGAADLERALLAALREDAAHLAAVRHFIDTELARRGHLPPLPVTLPDDPRVRALTVRPHRLADYEPRTEDPADEHPDDRDDDALG